ncbi:MAG: pilus assembly protein TadG-related protein, partial [Bdellovibrionales bacterium]
MMIKIIKNKKGQVAIFIALLFQVLFLFFAMVVNVGLLVHHKINLQNSVDLA